MELDFGCENECWANEETSRDGWKTGDPEKQAKGIKHGAQGPGWRRAIVQASLMR
jgi:hypothetical protein